MSNSASAILHEDCHGPLQYLVSPETFQWQLLPSSYVAYLFFFPWLRFDSARFYLTLFLEYVATLDAISVIVGCSPSFIAISSHDYASCIQAAMLQLVAFTPVNHFL